MSQQPGDVLLLGHQGSPIARCVRILSDSPWNHAGIVGPDGGSVYHCPGQPKPAVVKTPIGELPGLLDKPGYGRICITAYRHDDSDAAFRAAEQAKVFHDEQPFEYSMGQNGILGTLLWAQQSSHAVNAVLGAVLEQLEEVSDDVLSETAINCTEFVWRCFDDTGCVLSFATAYYDRGPEERDPITGIPQKLAPNASTPGYQRHPHDTPLNRLIEKIVRLGRRPAPADIEQALCQQPPRSAYVLAQSADDDVIPDLLVPRDFARAEDYMRVAAWPRDPWPAP